MNFFRNPYKAAFALAVLFVLTALTYRLFFMEGPVGPLSHRIQPVLGEAGSDHRHATLGVMIGDRAVSFCEPQYMIKSDLVHFEDDNCYVIHKHARGVTLATFFKTLGVGLTDKCITIPGEEKRCDDGVNHLRVVWNGTEVSIADLSFFELGDDDRILINFGPEEGTTLRFKSNLVPSVPEFVRETSVGRTPPATKTSL